MRTSTLLRAEEFARIADVLGPCELVNGEIITMSPGGLRHSEVTGRAYFLLESHNRAHRLGRVLTGETGFIVRRHPDTVRGADVAFISYQRLPPDTSVTGFLETPAELVVEVLSDDTPWGAMELKIAEYHAAGVDLVWVLDPRTLTLRVYERNAAPALLRETDVANADPQVPGFSCLVGEFFVR
ncbi:MAG: Uma2 family endonuclease [Acidobacteriota bacterium]